MYSESETTSTFCPSISAVPAGRKVVNAIPSFPTKELKSGFDTFSHHKSILDKPFWFEANFKYAPYSNTKLKIIKWLME